MNTHAVLVAPAELAAATAATLVVDCRFALADPGKGRSDFLAAHIPRAVYASLNDDLSDLSKTGLGRHPLPDAAAFARTLARWGWQPGVRIVAYDDMGGALAAARLWWMVRAVGGAAAVLDGGWKAWQAADLPVERGPANATPAAAAELAFDSRRAVGFDELERLRGQPANLLLDARAAPRFRGEVEPIDRVGGHIPGAHNRPFAENLDAQGRFKPAAELRAEFTALLAGRAPGDVVHSCGSGVTACHNLLAMEAAGLAGSRLFAPSWSGWIADPARPVATGA